MIFSRGDTPLYFSCPDCGRNPQALPCASNRETDDLNMNIPTGGDLWVKCTCGKVYLDP